MYYGSAKELWIPYNVDQPHLPKHGWGQSVEIIPWVMDLIASPSTDETSSTFPFSLNCLVHPFHITCIYFLFSSLGIAWPQPFPLNTASYLSLLKQFINSARQAPTIVLFFKEQNLAASSEIILSKQRQLV